MAGDGAPRLATACSGAVVRVATRAEGRAVERSLVGSDPTGRFDLVEVVSLRPPRPGAAAVDPRAAWARTVDTLRRYGPAAAVALVDAALATHAGADRDRARLIANLVSLHLAGDPFVVVVVDPTGDHLPRDDVRALGAALGTEWRVVGAPADLEHLVLHRPPRPDPVASAPADLLTILLGPDTAVPTAAERWLTPAAIDTTVGFSIVGPAVAERLRTLGLRTPDTPRLEGLRRRAWYRNALLRDLALQAVGALATVGITPTVLGDLVDAVEAEREGRVRPLGELTLLVGPDDLERAVAALVVGLGVETAPRTSPRRLRDGRIPVRLGGGRTVHLTSRWLPGNGDRRVPFDAGLVETLDVDGTPVAALPPTPRLLERWTRTFDLRRHDRLASIVGVLDLLARPGVAFDEPWLDRACERLELLPVPRRPSAREQ